MNLNAEEKEMSRYELRKVLNMEEDLRTAREEIAKTSTYERVIGISLFKGVSFEHFSDRDIIRIQFHQLTNR